MSDTRKQIEGGDRYAETMVVFLPNLSNSVPTMTLPAPLNTETMSPSTSLAPNAAAIDAALLITISPPELRSMSHTMARPCSCLDSILNCIERPFEPAVIFAVITFQINVHRIYERQQFLERFSADVSVRNEHIFHIIPMSVRSIALSDRFSPAPSFFSPRILSMESFLVMLFLFVSIGNKPPSFNR